MVSQPIHCPFCPILTLIETTTYIFLLSTGKKLSNDKRISGTERLTKT